MLNAEKFKDEILAKVDKTERFAIETNNQNVLRNCIDLECSECLFNEGTGLCYFERMKWLLSKYKKHIKLTRLEYEILKWEKKEGYKYIARTSSNSLFFYANKPNKLNYCWVSKDNNDEFFGMFNKLFQFVQWEDEEPYSIEEVLKNCVIEED